MHDSKNTNDPLISSENFVLVFNSLPGLFIVLDLDFKVMAVSEAWLGAANYQRHELIGKNLFEVVTDDPNDPVRTGVDNLGASLKRVLKTKMKDTMPIQKYSVPTLDGSFEVKYWSPTNAPVFDQNGELIYLVHRVEEVTSLMAAAGDLSLKGFDLMSIDVLQRSWEIHKTAEQFRAEAERKSKKLLEQTIALAESREILRASIDAISDYAVIILDHTGVITSWNSGATRITGYSADEAVGKNYLILSPSDAQERGDPLRQLNIAAERGRFRAEVTRMRKDKSYYLADVLIIPLFDQDDKLFGFSKVLYDMTERRLRMQEEEQTRINIENLKSEKELRERFIHTLSHDLRTPLSIAKGCAQFIFRQSCTRERLEELASRIIGSMDRADKMLTDLLDVSRIKSGQFLSLNCAEMELSSFLNEIKDDFSTIHGPRLMLHLEGEVRGHWDGMMLRRAIENLLNNAVKYGSKTEPITMSLQHSEEQVQISIINLGSVIDSSELETLFDPFHRTRTAEGKEGWGLGLTLVRGVAETHGGSVKVQSGPISGTVFTLVLPSK